MAATGDCVTSRAIGAGRTRTRSAASATARNDSASATNGSPREAVQRTAERWPPDHRDRDPGLIRGDRVGQRAGLDDLGQQTPLGDHRHRRQRGVEERDDEQLDQRRPSGHERDRDAGHGHSAHEGADDHQTPAIDPVGNRATRERGDRVAQRAGKADEARVGRRAGEKQDEQRHGERGGLRADLGQDVARPEQREVAVGAQGARSFTRRRRCRSLAHPGQARTPGRLPIALEAQELGSRALNVGEPSSSDEPSDAYRHQSHPSCPDGTRAARAGRADRARTARARADPHPDGTRAHCARPESPSANRR
jgi:hypothetical protein